MAAANGSLTPLLLSLAGGKECPVKCLQSRLAEAKVDVDSPEFVAALDKEFSAHPSCQRQAFLIPKAGNFEKAAEELIAPSQDAIYLCGHSLGLQPKRTRELVAEELDKWARVGVEGHWTGERPWMPIDEWVTAKSAAVVGALESEVAIMNGLTVNLHLLMVALYRPKGKRIRILYESDAFPSDYHAFLSHCQTWGLDPKEALLPITPRPGEDLLRGEDVIKAIEDAGDTLAIVILGVVQYYTGQYFDVPAVYAASQKVGAPLICQCAHAAGNVNLKLHDWGVDGAVWCSYKYLNSGPGGIAGFFLHEKHHSRVAEMPKFAGWWGHKKQTRFDMAHVFHPEPGAAAFRLCNPPVLQTVSLLASLDVFSQASFDEIRGRSMVLTAFLEMLLQKQVGEDFKVITPSDPLRRGAALSLKFADTELCETVDQECAKRGVVIDYRKPNVLRCAPAPLYNTFADVLRFTKAMEGAIAAVRAVRAAQNGSAKRARLS